MNVHKQMKHIFFEKPGQCWAIITFAVILLILVIIAMVFARSYFHEDYIITASGRQHLDFRVFYLENRIFDENPMPRHLEFLMSYTDFIEVDSSFTASFSEEMDIFYSYRTEKRFVIRNMGTADLHRLVFEEVFLLSETSGQVTASQIIFGIENDGRPGGRYIIFPKEHIDLYFDFVEDQAQQMETEGVIAQGLRGFTAELLIDFTYTIRVPEFELNETITHGYRLPLTTEIYSLLVTGTPNFEWQTNIAIQEANITVPMVILFVIAFSLSLFGLLYNIKNLMADPNELKREVDTILKKYTHEIVIYDKPASFTSHIQRNVYDFSDLLKLAINLNKHIMCYRDETHTEFVVIVGEFACIYAINYNEPDEEVFFGDDKEESDRLDKKEMIVVKENEDKTDI